MWRTIPSTLVLVLVLQIAPHTTQAAGWIPLFDGSSMSGWTTPEGQPVARGAWAVSDGAIHLNVSKGRGGNVITDREFGDFELVFEWKIASRANSGIKYRVKDFQGQLLGCEYQMIDDQGYGHLRPAQTTAALYDVYEPMAHEPLKPPGQYNRGTIIVCGNCIEHYLNGRLVVSAVVGSDEWRRRIAASKFNDVAGFGENRSGRIMLTDHGDEIWFRNIFIRPLIAPAATTRSRVSLTRWRPRRLLKR
jgi:hypothetical protein